MADALFDTTVLVDCLRQRPDALALVAARAAEGPLRTHVDAAAELFDGARNLRELRLADDLLSRFEIIAPTEADGLAALSLYRDHRLAHGVDWPDCQIAATALRLGVEVLTLNVKHFAVLPGVSVVRAY